MFKVKLRRFHLLRSGDVAINRSGPKPRQHVLICRHGEGASNTLQSHTKEVRVAMQKKARKGQHTQTIISACDTCFIYYFGRKARLCDGNHISYIGIYSWMSFSIGLVVPEPYQCLSSRKVLPSPTSIGSSTHRHHNASGGASIKATKALPNQK